MAPRLSNRYRGGMDVDNCCLSECCGGGGGSAETRSSSTLSSDPRQRHQTQHIERIVLSPIPLISPLTGRRLLIRFDHDHRFKITKALRAFQVLRPLMLLAEHLIGLECGICDMIFHDYNLNIDTEEKGNEFANKFNELSQKFIESLKRSGNKVVVDLSNCVHSLIGKHFSRYHLPKPRGWPGGSPEDHLIHWISNFGLRQVLEYSYATSVTNPRKLNSRAGEVNQTYGETSFDCIDYIVQTLFARREFRRFVDLGSGVGNVVLQLAGTVPLESCVGIEISDWPNKFCTEIAINFERLMRWLGYPYSPFSLEQGDFLDPKFENVIRNADVIFINNACFDSSVNEALRALFLTLKDGVRIITVKAIPSRSEKPQFRTDFRTSIRLIAEIPGFSVSWCANTVNYHVQEIQRDYIIPRVIGFNNPRIASLLHKRSEQLCKHRFTWIEREIARIRNEEVYRRSKRSQSCGDRKVPFRNVIRLCDHNRRFNTRRNDTLNVFCLFVPFSFTQTKARWLICTRLSWIPEMKLKHCIHSWKIKSFTDGGDIFNEPGILESQKKLLNINMDVRTCKRCDVCWTNADLMTPPFRHHSVSAERVSVESKLKELDNQLHDEVKLRVIAAEKPSPERKLKRRKRPKQTLVTQDTQSVLPRQIPSKADLIIEHIAGGYGGEFPINGNVPPISFESTTTTTIPLVELAKPSVAIINNNTQENGQREITPDRSISINGTAHEFKNRKRRKSSDLKYSIPKKTSTVNIQNSDEFSMSPPAAQRNTSTIASPDGLIRVYTDLVRDMQKKSKIDLDSQEHLIEQISSAIECITRGDWEITTQFVVDFLTNTKRCIEVSTKVAGSKFTNEQQMWK